MRKFKAIFIISVLTLLILIPIIAISGCGRAGGEGKAGQEKVMYHCPMHPTYTSDRPGDCPICGMKLVKIESEEKPGKEHPAEGEMAKEKTLKEVCVEHDCTMKDCVMHVITNLKPGERIICPVCGEVISTTSGKVVEIGKEPAHVMGSEEATGPSVMISMEKQQLIGVTTEPVKILALEKMIRASGKIAYDPELVITQEEFVQALKNEENTKDSPLQDVIDRAKALTEAARKKLKLLGMSDDQITQLEKTKIADMGLYLPGKGENVWAYISVYEYEIGLVQPGEQVDIEAVAYPGEVFQGAVVSINPVLDPMTRTNQIRVQVPNPGDKLKPEMFVNSKIRVNLGEVLALPEAAVLDTGLRKIVYLSREGDRLESREVTLGRKAEGYYEVVSGLKEGDIVVTSGNFLIDSESRLKSAISQSTEHKHGQ